jgi:hypothetical protein
MKATVPNLHASRASVAHLAVGRVAIGPISIEQLLLRDTKLAIKSGRARLMGMVVTVRLRFDLKWGVHIPLPWPFDDIDIGTTSHLGSASLSFAFPDTDIPSLTNINLTLPQVNAANVTTSADPITGLALDSLVAEDIRATNVIAPTPGFTLSGLGLGSAGVDGLGVPSARIAGATVGHVRGAPLQLGSLVLRGLALPSATANDISSAPFDVPVVPQAVLRVPPSPLPLGVLSAQLIVTPSASAHINRLFLTGVKASANVGTIEVHNVKLPYDALNITLSDIGIETIDIPTIGVA